MWSAEISGITFLRDKPERNAPTCAPTHVLCAKRTATNSWPPGFASSIT
jgi:hypothetical protein